MPIPAFRLLALTEAVSWLLLIGAAVLKRAADLPEATQIMGPIHGVIFLVYAGAVLYVRDDLKWPAGRTLMALFAALLPLQPDAMARAVERLDAERHSRRLYAAMARLPEGQRAVLELHRRPSA